LLLHSFSLCYLILLYFTLVFFINTGTKRTYYVPKVLKYFLLQFLYGIVKMKTMDKHNSSISYITFLFSITFQVVGLIHLFSNFTYLRFRNIWFTYNFAFLGISIALSIIIFLFMVNVKNRHVNYFFYFIKTLLVIFTGYPSGGYFNIKLVLLCSLVLEIILHGRLWKDVIISIIILIGSCFFIIYTKHSFIDWGVSLVELTISDLLLLIIYPFFIIILCSIIKLFEYQISSIRQIAERLKDGGANLAETNIYLQEQILTIENEAVESERKRVSREIHDIVGHTLMSIILMMKQVLQMKIKYPSDVKKLLVQTHDQAKEGLEETRKALTILKEKKALNIPLMNAVHRLINAFQGTYVSIHVEFSNSPNDFGDPLNGIIYRFIQEGITNAIRHGNANEINIYFWLDDDTLQIVISDNGIGCEQFVLGIGLNGIGERMAQIHGRFETQNVSKGFKLIAYIPFTRDLPGRNKD